MEKDDWSKCNYSVLSVHTFPHSTVLFVMFLGNCLLTSEDFENFKVQEREPLNAHIKNGNYTLVTLPPPSGGLVLLTMLKILDGELIKVSSKWSFVIQETCS